MFFILINYNILHPNILSKYKYSNYLWNYINECYCTLHALHLISIIGLGCLSKYNS